MHAAERLRPPALLLFAVTVWVPSCRCASDGSASSVPNAIWSTSNPLQVADESLPDADYVALGVPAHGQHWSSEDMREALVHLHRLAATRPMALPRSASVRSGKVFARITSAETLTVLHDPSMPISIRLPAALAYTHELNGIYDLYVSALRSKTVTGSDLVELHAARLHVCQTLLELAEEFLPTLATSDPRYQSRIAGIDAMQSGTTDAMLAALAALADPLDYGLPARKRLVTTCRATFPPMARRLKVAKRDTLLQELRTTAASPNLANLQPELGSVLDEVAHAVATAPDRTAL